jgi:membrane associated rhomboid family serine protease
MKFVSLLRRPFSYKYYNATLVLIIICAVFFLLQNITPITTIELYNNQIKKDVIKRINIVTKYFALIPEEIGEHGHIWQVATYMFTHGGIFHILINMLILFMFGTQLEREFGSNEFLLYYFTVGIGAGIILAFGYPLLGISDAVVVGASAAIYGLLLAFATRHAAYCVHSDRASFTGHESGQRYCASGASLRTCRRIPLFSGPFWNQSHRGNQKKHQISFLLYIFVYNGNPPSDNLTRHDIL